MIFKFFVLCCATGVALASSRYSAPRLSASSSFRSDEIVEPPKYDFEWGVRDSESANHFGQQETRDLDETKGSYFVLLPDGRTQRVSYYVDGDSGFVAEVSYEGSGAPAPLRRAPSPRYG